MVECQLRKTEASRVLASQYSISVPTVQKQYDWGHGPIINGGESSPVFYKGRRHGETKVHVNSGEFNVYKAICESVKRLTC